MTARRRREGETAGVKARSETEIEAGGQQLAGQGGTAAEAVDSPARGGAQALVHGQQDIERPDAMDGDRQGIPLGQNDLPPEDFPLHVDAGTPQTIQSALAYGYCNATLQKPFQPLEKRLRIATGPPRMDAGGIKRTGTGNKVGGTQQDSARKIDNGATGRGGKVVGVEIEKGSGHEGPESGYGIVTAATPGMTTQQTAHGQPQAFEGTVPAQGLDGILRARGSEPAGGRHERRHISLIEQDGSQQQGGEQASHGSTGLSGQTGIAGVTFSARLCIRPAMRRPILPVGTGRSASQTKAM